MNATTVAEYSPDFTLTDTEGQTVRLMDVLAERHVVLVFNRGFS